nr:PREDICTED: uncharacterized protein LOC105662459 isoform X2 [Megachile rotundata]
MCNNIYTKLNLTIYNGASECNKVCRKTINSSKVSHSVGSIRLYVKKRYQYHGQTFFKNTYLDLCLPSTFISNDLTLRNRNINATNYTKTKFPVGSFT